MRQIAKIALLAASLSIGQCTASHGDQLEKAFLSKSYSVAGLSIRLTRPAEDVARISVRWHEPGKSMRVRESHLNFETFGQIIGLDFVRIGRSGDSVLAITQRTHFGAVDLFVCNPNARSIKHSLSCISAITRHLNKGIVDERALAKYVYDPGRVPKPLSSSSVMQRRWVWHHKTHRFKAGRWYPLASHRSGVTASTLPCHCSRPLLRTGLSENVDNLLLAADLGII